MAAEKKESEKKELDYFMILDLPIYGKVGLIDGKGIHYFNAMMNCKGDTSKFLKHLILELLVVEGNFVTEKFIDEMSLKDINYLVTVVSIMMGDNYKNGI